MTEEVYHNLKNILANRPRLKIEAIIDGYSGFLLIDQEIQKIALGQSIATYHAPCISSYVLYQHGKCGYGYKDVAVSDGAF